MQITPFISGWGATSSGTECLLLIGFARPSKRSLASKCLHLPGEMAEIQTHLHQLLSCQATEFFGAEAAHQGEKRRKLTNM